MSQQNLPPVPPNYPPGPPLNYPQSGGYVPPLKTNGFAVASLICAIVGFCVPVIGGLLGVILGVVGIGRAKTPGVGGKGLSVAGITVGVLTLLFWGVAGLGITKFLSHGGLGAIQSQLVVQQYFMNLSQGNVDAAVAQTAGLPREDVAAQSDDLKALGAFRAAKSTSFNYTNGVVTFGGTATFTNGLKGYKIELVQQNGVWKIRDAKIE